MSNRGPADKPDVHQFFRRSLADVLRNRRHDGRAQDDGFSLIELMVALFVFALLASGFAATMGVTLKAFQRARVKTLGEQIANDQLENARRVPYDSCDLAVSPGCSGLGNIGGNPLGSIPLTSTQSVGGYVFTVTTKVSFVDDPVAVSIPTGADYKQIDVTVVAVGLGAPALTMSSLVAPPSKPPADRGRVTVKVYDMVSDSAVANIGVDLIKGPSGSAQRDVSDANGIVSFPNLVPSVNIGPSPAPGPNDYYYANRGTAPPLPAIFYPLPANYYQLPISLSSTPLSPNKFTVPAATSVNSVLSVYQAALVTLQITDAGGAAWQDDAVASVSSVPIGMTNPPIAGRTLPGIVAGGPSLAAFNEAPLGTGIVPKGAYTYTFTVAAPDGCSRSVTPADLYDSATYVTNASYTVPISMPCTYSSVKLHVTDLYDGSNVAGASVAITGGPLGVPRTAPPTDAQGYTTIRLRVGTPNYVATVNMSGRAPVSVSFPVTTSAPPTAPLTPADIKVPAPTKVVDVTVTDGFTKAALPNAIVKTTGGTGAVVPNCTTDSLGRCPITVPTAAASPPYTIAVQPDTAGRLGISGTVVSTNTPSPISLEDPWAAMMTVNVHVIDAVTGANLGPSSVRLTGGPPNATVTALTTYTTDANGDIVGGISVPVGTGAAYTLTVPALAPRILSTVTFPATGAPPATVQLPVLRPMSTFTITVRGNNGAQVIQPGKNVTVTGGPSAFTWNIVTDVNGQAIFTVPTGASPPYTVTVPGFPISSQSPSGPQTVNGNVSVTVKLTGL